MYVVHTYFFFFLLPSPAFYIIFSSKIMHVVCVASSPLSPLSSRFSHGRAARSTCVMITSVLPNNRPPGSYSDVWRRKRRRCEGSTRRTNVGSNGGKADTTDNHEPLVLKFPTILIIISFTLSSILILIDGRGPSFAQAVDPPKAQSTPRHRGLSPDSSSHSEVNNSDAVMDDWSGKYTTKVRSPEDDSTLRETEKKYPDNDEISSPSYEPKTNKHRQKHRVVSGGRQSSESEYDAYMHWCEKVLGIQSVVEIREFEYVDHLKLHWEENAKEEYDPQGFDWLKQYTESVEENDRNIDDGHDAYEIILPTKLVRGLAAKYDILPGDIVISIPLYSLLSVPTTIDHDPVLSRILGPDARKMYGWIDTAEYELQLLILAVLYHRSLGKDSPMSHYVDILLGTPTDSFPFLWSDRELNEKVGDEEVKTMARGIRLRLHEMYDEIMGTLVQAKPELFAPPSGYVLNQSGQGDESEWAYSYENFQWAFAMVVSRHHYLPLHDFDDDDEDTPEQTKQTLVKKAISPSNKQIMHETLSSVSEVTPPANQRKFLGCYWSRYMLECKHFSRFS